MSHSQASSAGDPQDAGTAPADYNAWQQMTRTVAHYERLEQIGEGTYGQVYRARCKDSGRIVALKKMRIHHGGYWGMPLQLIREIKILKRLRHPNLLQMIEVVTSKGVEHLDNDDPLAKNHQVKDRVADARESYKGNLFLVLEYVEHDLTGLLDVAYQFTPVQIKCIFKQLLEALAFMHQNKYVHRDIKSSNLLLDSNFTLKLADFGLARSIEAPLLDQVQERKASLMSGPEFTNKVITLWYRPPEILLGAVQYGTPVDVWSAGCILAELILGKPLFAAKTELDQLQMILEMLGPPPSSETYDFFESGMKKDTTKVPLSLSRTEKPPSKFRPKYKSKMPAPALALIEKMLAWDPRQRVTAANALTHRYFWSEPAAPANPAELGETLNLGGPNGHFHEFQTKKKRKQAKVIADEAKDVARHNGATEEEAQEVYDKTYRGEMKRVFEEGFGAKEDSIDSSRKDDRRRISSSRGRVGEEESRRRDRSSRDRGSRDRFDGEPTWSESESRRRDSEPGKKRRRDDPNDARRSHRSRERQSRENNDMESERREEPGDVQTLDDPARNGDAASRDKSPSGSAERLIKRDRDVHRGRDPRDVGRPDDFMPLEDPEYGRERQRYDDRERFLDPEGRIRGRPTDMPPFDDRGPADGRGGRERPIGRPPLDGRGAPDRRDRDRLPFEDRRPPFDDRGPPDGGGRVGPIDLPPFDDRGSVDGRGRRDRPMDRRPFDNRGPLVGRGGRERSMDRLPFDGRGSHDARERNIPPFHDRGPPDGRERPLFNDHHHLGRERPIERPSFDDRGPSGRDRPMDRPPFDDRGPPGRGRPIDRPPFDDRGPPGRDRPMDRPPMDRPPFNDMAHQGGRGGRNRPPFEDGGMTRNGALMDERSRGRPAFEGRDRPRDMPPFEREGPRDRLPMDDRRRRMDRGPAGDRNASGGDLRFDERERRRMGPPPYDDDQRRGRGFPEDRSRPAGDGLVEKDFDRARGPPPRDTHWKFGPALDVKDDGRRDFSGRPNSDPDRLPFPNEPPRLDEPESRPGRSEGGDGRRDKSDRRSDSHRRRKKDKKRRERSRSRGRNDEPKRKDRIRDDRRPNNDGNPDYYGQPNVDEGDRRREGERDKGDRRDRHRDRH